MDKYLLFFDDGRFSITTDGLLTPLDSSFCEVEYLKKFDSVENAVDFVDNFKLAPKVLDDDCLENLDLNKFSVYSVAYSLENMLVCSEQD